jgi:hypothetical protein
MQYDKKQVNILVAGIVIGVGLGAYAVSTTFVILQKKKCNCKDKAGEVADQPVTPAIEVKAEKAKEIPLKPKPAEVLQESEAILTRAQAEAAFNFLVQKNAVIPKEVMTLPDQNEKNKKIHEIAVSMGYVE